ncbi:unnamed protein product [Microthlaspi erraticum]|uniref:Uncharacterized protein n=1 Tax=Microthlaspi erraticum TaxID=1685480 RepID=A0A6D2J078_9BRAS|nr:unnamed protein product [Microthlaspi erraticum]
MASMVGHKYGVLRWSKTGKKTVEGTAAGRGNNIGDGSVLRANSGVGINGIYTEPRMVVAACSGYSHRDVGSLHGAAR